MRAPSTCHMDKRHPEPICGRDVLWDVSSCLKPVPLIFRSSCSLQDSSALLPAGLRNLYVAATPELQLGGKPGKSVVFGGHLVRSFLRWQSQAKCSCFVLYADIIASAFYSVARQLVAKDDSMAGTDGGINLSGISLSRLSGWRP